MLSLRQIINPLLNKFVRSKSKDTGLVLFCFMDPEYLSINNPNLANIQYLVRSRLDYTPGVEKLIGTIW